MPIAHRLARSRLALRLRKLGNILLFSSGFILSAFAVQQLLSHQAVSPVPPAATNQQVAPPQLPSPQARQDLAYNVPSSSPLPHSQSLQAIVDGAVALAASQGLNTQPLSITLLDLKSNEIAGYQNEVLRYPASVVKLFWLVICQAQLEAGILPLTPDLQSDLRAMIVNSDNDAASRIFDRITDTTSGPTMAGADYTTWLQKRLHLNQFFRTAGFDGISISQKNYPIYSLNLEGPEGRELQMVDDQQKPIRSLVSSDQAARLMAEIYRGTAVSNSRSQEMMALLTRDLQSSPSQPPDNSVAGFLGESLPSDVRYASKVGYTTKVRHEVALIESKDGKVAYVLAVFGEDPAYSQNGTFFPDVSKMVFAQMLENSTYPQTKPQTEGT